MADVWVLSGRCQIRQGGVQASGEYGVLWVEQGLEDDRGPIRVTSYLEGGVSVSQQSSQTDEPASTYRSHHWIGEFRGTRLPQVRIPQLQEGPPTRSLLLDRAIAARFPRAEGVIRQTQYNEPVIEPTADAPPPGLRRIRAFPRSDVRVQAQWFPRTERDEYVAVVTGGVTIIVDGVDSLGSIDLSADRIVVWTQGAEPDLTGQSMQRADVPLEVYMEGNIEFRQGDRVVFANRMYYDVRHQVGVVLDAELLTPVPEYAGKLRVKADVLRQISKDQFLAQGALVTSSRMGVPGYSLRSEMVYFEDHQSPISTPFGQPAMDDRIDQPMARHRRFAQSYNNFIYVGEFPVLYWPLLSTDLDNANFYVREAKLATDNIFGTQVLTTFSGYEVFGVDNPIEGTDWEFSIDYLSFRGLGLGTSFEYETDHFFGLTGPTEGFIDAWGIKDHGLDNLGAGRNNIPPETDHRGRLLARHRQELGDGYQVSAEIGWISDPNFLEQYFENEWDTFKDLDTRLELKRYAGNTSWDVFGTVRLNDFFTETEWLPRADHFWLGESLLGDRLTWFEHTSVGYARLKVASPPEDPTQAAQWELLPWEVEQSGERFATRQEIDLPMQLGNFKVVPYALGELAHWGADINGDPIQRAYGQLGVRASVPMWRVDPNVQLPLLYVNGLAHKVEFNAEFAYADSSQDLDEFPLYDQLDDNSQLALRRRQSFEDFGGTGIPPQFDERFYAVRFGMQDYVTSPVTEIAEDLTVLRLGMNHRWQTKRGAPGEQRIIDWITLDMNASLFPEPDRDNFGEVIGLVDYDFRWHVGDRFTVLSSGIADVFSDGQKLFNIGGSLNRPERGNIYMGLRVLEGPIRSHVGLTAFSYRLGPKWIATAGASIGLDDQTNITQSLSITRVGESFLVRVGFNYDESKDDIGVKLAIEPRLFRSRRGDTIDGIYVPPAGAFGLE